MGQYWREAVLYFYCKIGGVTPCLCADGNDPRGENQRCRRGWLPT